MIIGIAAGGGVALIAIIVIVVLLVLRYRRNKRKPTEVALSDVSRPSSNAL